MSKIKGDTDFKPAVSPVEFIIINIPDLLFLAGAVICLVITFFSAGYWRILLFIGAWWSFSGFIMLAIDYRRKQVQYLKLIRRSRISSGMHRKLCQTLCGFCLYLSYLYRQKVNKIPYNI